MTILGYSDTEFVAGSIALFLALISFICTIVTLWLIYDMKRRNGYLLLINSLTTSQLIYDLAFVFLPFYSNEICLDMLTFMCTFAGMAVTLWTNVISLVLYNIVRNLRSFDIYSYYHKFAAAIFIPSLILACLVVGYYGQQPYFGVFNEIYYWIRIASILFNVLIHGLISYKLSKMGYRERGVVGGQDDPVRVLASRIKYYPVVQIVARAGAAWYEFAYGFETDSYSRKHMGTTQTVALFFYALCVPTAGIGYFLVFLKVQPAAYTHLSARLRQLAVWVMACFCFCCVDADDWRRRSRDDSISAGVFVPPSKADHRQPLLSVGGASGNTVLCDFSELDEDELSFQIDQRYYTLSCDSASVITANTAGARSSTSNGPRQVLGVTL